MNTSSTGSELDPNMGVGKILEFIRSSPIRLAVFGEFSSGKSTFINAMIGEDILSVAVDPTTAVPVYIKYGREFNIFVNLTSNDKLKLFEDEPPFWARFVGRANTLNTLKKQQSHIKNFLRQWTTENQHANKVDHVSLELPIDWLKSGIEIVDTPGLNAGFTKHQKFTETVSQETDIAILLMDARHGGGKRTEFKSMNGISEQVYNSFVVLNKLDLLDLEERNDIISFVKDEALPKHWNGAVPPKLFALSAKVRIDPEIAEREKELENHFTSFMVDVGRIIEGERGKILLFKLGNPEKGLFNRGKKLEFEGEHDQAHRIYFDLLDILTLAKLNTQPALDGIRRCEENLTKQVNTLDAINSEIIRADECEQDDPDSALTILTRVTEKFSLLKLKEDVKETDLRIKTLVKRIQKRDDALRGINSIQEKALKFFEKGDFIRCVDTIKKIEGYLSKAELSLTEQLEFRNIIVRYTAKKDDWVENKRGLLTNKVNDYLNNCNYKSAATLLPELEQIISLLDKPHHTSSLVIRVKKVCTAFENYKQLSKDLEREFLPILKQVKVKWIDINKYKSVLNTLKNYYITLFPKYEDLKIETNSHGTINVLTIGEKKDIAEYIKEYIFESQTIIKVLKEFGKREIELQQMKFSKQMSLEKAFEFYNNYSDHYKLHKIISNTFELSLKKANKTRFRKKRIQRLIQIALNNSEIGFIENAEKAFNVANAEALSISDIDDSVKTLRFIANNEFAAGLEQQSIKTFRTAIDRFRKSSLTTQTQYGWWRNIAEEQAKLGLLQESKATFKSASEFVVELFDPDWACVKISDLALQLTKYGFNDLAKETFSKAIELLNKVPDFKREEVLNTISKRFKDSGLEAESSDIDEPLTKVYNKIKKDYQERKAFKKDNEKRIEEQRVKTREENAFDWASYGYLVFMGIVAISLFIFMLILGIMTDSLWSVLYVIFE